MPEAGESINQPNTDDGAIPQTEQRKLSIFQALRPVAIIFGLVMLINLVTSSALAFIPIYLVDKHAIAPVTAAMFVRVIRGGGIIGSLLGGWLSDNWGRKKAIFLTLIAIGPALYLLTTSPFNAGLIVIFILFGMLTYMRASTFLPLLMDSTPYYLRATIYGIYFGLAQEGVSIIQPVAGHFMDIFGIIDVFNIIAFIGLACSLLVLLIVKKTKMPQVVSR